MRGWLQRRLCLPWCIQFCSGVGQCWRRRHLRLSTHHPHSKAGGAFRHWPQLERCASHLYSSAANTRSSSRRQRTDAAAEPTRVSVELPRLPFMDEGLSMKKSPSQTMEKSTGRSPASSPSYQYCTHSKKQRLRHQTGAPGPDADRGTAVDGPGTNL